MRRDRDSFARINWPAFAVDDTYCRTIRDRVRGFLDASTVAHQVLTNEDLSYLRHPDEFDRLADLLDHPRRKVKVTLIVRDRESFLHRPDSQSPTSTLTSPTTSTATTPVREYADRTPITAATNQR